MKKLLLSLVALLCLQVSASAQYTFTKTTGTYTNLTGGTVASFLGWDENQYTIPIGFTFRIGGLSYTSAVIYANGQLLFTSPNSTTKGIFGFDADLMDRGGLATLSPISYLTTGVAGSRILKVEWRNAGFYDLMGSTPGNSYPYPNDFVNFQIWIYEGNNRVEVRIGSSNITASNSSDIFGATGGPTVGVISNILANPNRYTGVVLQNQAATPTAVTLTNANTIPQLTGVPASGTIYRFNSTVNGVSDALENAGVSVYPNPATDILTIEGLTAKQGTATLKIYDLLGKVIVSQELAISKNMPVNVSALAKGTYFLELTTAEGRLGKQIIKQ